MWQPCTYYSTVRSSEDTLQWHMHDGTFAINMYDLVHVHVHLHDVHADGKCAIMHVHVHVMWRSCMVAGRESVAQTMLLYSS